MQTRFLGRAATIAQVVQWTFSAPAINDVYTVKINGKVVTFTATTIVVADLAAGLVAAIAASTIVEFTKLTAAVVSTNKLQITGASTGEPFTVVITSSGAGTITPATTTTAQSPKHWNVADNWSGGAVPVNGDDAVVDLQDAEIFWGLDQSAVTLNSLITSGLSHRIGLPDLNASGYVEYLDRDLKIGVTTGRYGVGDGPGPARLRINFGAVQTSAELCRSGNGEIQGLPAVLFSGSNANNVYDIVTGYAGIVYDPATTGAASSIRIGPGAVVVTGPGLSTVPTVKNAGTLTMQTGTSSFTQSGGAAALKGTGAHAAIVVNNGVLSYESAGTATAVTVGPGTIDASVDPSARTFTGTTIKAGGSIIDPSRTITFTNGITLDSSVKSLQAA